MRSTAQELVRTLGQFSTFATGFAFISILTGMFLLFGFAYATGGPASIWAWVIAVVGQLLFALAFAELAVRYPLAGSVYSWAKQLSSTTVSWLAGLAMTLALIVSTAAVALAFLAIVPSISSVFWIYGNGSGKYDASINSVILGLIALAASTAVFLCGAKVRKVVNNIGVSVELIGVLVMIVLLLFHVHHGPQVLFKTNGTGLHFTGGYLGVLAVCLLVGLTVQWGFDTAGSVGEETINPRKACPRGIIRALLASGIFGALLFFAAFMSVKNLHDPQVANLGLAYVPKSAVGNVIGDIMLAAAAIAVFVCLLANQTGAVNMIFAMARDNGLPGSERLAKVAAHRRTPFIPPIIVAVVSAAILLALKQPQILLVTTSVTATLALLSSVLVVGPFARLRMRGQWPAPAKGYFTLGRAGLAVSLLAFVWGIGMIINLAWPRDLFYNPLPPFHWYLRWGGVLFPGIVMFAGFLVYWFVQRSKIGILPSHAAQALAAETPAESVSQAD
jgi:urea carboxylase system permease